MFLFDDGIKAVQIFQARYVADDRRNDFGFLQLLLSPTGVYDVCTFVHESLSAKVAHHGDKIVHVATAKPVT